MQELAIRKAMGIPKSNPIPMLKNTPYSGRRGLTMCDVLHPERCGSVACDAHFLDVIPQLFRRSLGVYVPVYAASTVAVQRAAVFKQPFKIAGKMLGGVLRSTVFLTAYVALAHRGVLLFCVGMPLLDSYDELYYSKIKIQRFTVSGSHDRS